MATTNREICMDKGNINITVDTPVNVIRAFLNGSIRDQATLPDGSWAYTLDNYTYWQKISGQWVNRGSTPPAGTPQTGPAGNGIATMTANGTGLVTVTYTNGSTSTFQLPAGQNGTNGRSVTSITANGTVATINYSDGTTGTFNLPSSGGGSSAGPARNVALTNDLRAVNNPVVGEIIIARGGVSEGDTGAGYWTWFTGTAPTDDGLVYVKHSTLSSGYFKRMGYDGQTIDLGWGAQPANVGSGYLQAVINTFPSNIIIVDKLYTNIATALQLPANSNFILRGRNRENTGFVSNGTLTTVLKVGIGTTVENLTVDGNYTTRAYQTGYSTESLVQFPYNTTNKARTKVIRLNLRNASQHAIYGNSANYATVEDIAMDGINAEAIWFQVSDHLHINKVSGRNLYKDGVKLHTKDGVNTTFQAYDWTVRDINLDYTGVVGGGNILAVELWGGQVGWVNNPNLEGIKIVGPQSMTTGVFWGISGDTVKGGQVTDFIVDGGTPGYVGIGIEAAGCIDMSYEHGTVRRYRYTGASLSQPATRGNKIENVTFRDAERTTTGGGTYAIQWYNGITGGSVLNSTFKDAGDRYLFFNTAGSGVLVQGNKFYVGSQPVGTGSYTQPFAFYVSGSGGIITGVKVISNEFGSVLWGDEVGVDTYLKPGDINGGATNWFLAFNTFDAKSPIGSINNAQFTMYGGGGGHTAIANIGLNYTAAFLGMYDGGPSSTFIYNTIQGSSTAAVNFRAGTDAIVSASATGTTGTSIADGTYKASTPPNGFAAGKIYYSQLSNSNISADTTGNYPDGANAGTLITESITTANGQTRAWTKQTWWPYNGTEEYFRTAQSDTTWSNWSKFTRQPVGTGNAGSFYATLSAGSVPAGGTVDLTASAPGARQGDVVVYGRNIKLFPGLYVRQVGCYADGVITITIGNSSASAVVDDTQNWNLRIIR